MCTPILDIVRDPRWGRTLGVMGKEPFLIAALGTEMVNGIRSQGVAATLSIMRFTVCPKAVVTGVPPTHVAPRELLELFLYPLKVVQNSHLWGDEQL